MNDVLFMLAGAASAAILVALVHRGSTEQRHRIYGAGLVVAVLIYVGFAAAAGATLVPELGGALVFSAMAVAGVRRLRPGHRRSDRRRTGEPPELKSRTFPDH